MESRGDRYIDRVLEGQSGASTWIMSKDSRGCSILDTPESREMAAQTDLWAKQRVQKRPTSRKSEVLRSLRHSMITCGHKAKDVTPSIVWRGKLGLQNGKRAATVSERRWEERKKNTIQGQRHRQRWNFFKNFLKATLGKGPRDWAERILALPSA